MGEWKRIKLSEVLKEKTERNKNNKTDLVLSVTNSQGFMKQSDFFEGTVHSEDISNYKLVRKNEFAYNPSRINVGSIDILKEYDVGALSPMYVIFSVDETKLLPDYFKYYFQTHKFNENVKNNTQGSVRNSLSFKDLSEFEYLLPPLEEQKRIVKILDQVNKIIGKYQNLINEKEQFIKSQFVEMFENKNYEKILIKKAIEKGFIDKPLDGNHGNKHPKTSDYVKQGIPFLMANNIKNGTVDCVNCNFITEKQALSLDKGFAKNDDVLITHKGTIGETAILHTNYEFVMLTPQITYYRVNKKYLIPEYLKEYFNSSKFQLIMKKIASSGSTRSYIGITEQQNLELMIPPIEVQRKFNQIVQLIDKQKFELEKQKQNYIDLKKGLMQQLLTGKLKVS